MTVRLLIAAFIVVYFTDVIVSWFMVTKNTYKFLNEAKLFRCCGDAAREDESNDFTSVEPKSIMEVKL